MDEIRVPAKTLSAGTASGPAINSGNGHAVAERRDVPANEREREKTVLVSALESSVAELRQLALRVEAELGKDKAEIFESHADIAEDDELHEDFFALVDEGCSASTAVRDVSERHAAEMEELDSEYFRARAEDFRDIGSRIIGHISAIERGCDVIAGVDASALCRFPAVPSIIVSKTLSPGQTVQFYLPNVLGFAVSSGGANSHAAILARSLGIPAVVIPENVLSGVSDGTEIVLNLESDTCVINPSKETLVRAVSARDEEKKRKERLAALKNLPAVTKCGRKIALCANGGNMKDLAGIVEANPDGIGLFRTEFLFMEQTSFPDEAAQSAYYRRVIDSMGDRPVIFRLLDIGGDKPLPYAPHPHENNPFLGWRGIRYLIDNPDILLSQIRAMLLASAATGKTVRIMVPMVSCPSEMEIVKKLIERESKETGGRAIPGMMVETPAAAMTVAAYRGLSEFISVGSNDLTQYTLAADRENELLGNLYSEFHPGVLALMKKACEDAHAAGMETGICGEFASRPEGAIYLAAMGFDELSMSAGAIPAVKELLRNIDLDEVRPLLEKALAMRDAEGVRHIAREFLEGRDLLR